MTSLKNIKPCSKVYPGHLRHKGDKKEYKPKHSKSEREAAKRVFTIERDTEGSEDSLPFLHRRSRGTFEIHVVNVQLTESCLKYIKDQFTAPCEVKVSWKFMNHDKHHTPLEECTDLTIVFDTIYHYKIDLTEDFIDWIRKRKITFELFALSNEKQICLGKGRTNYNIILDNPEIKHRIRLELYDYYKARQVGHKPKPCARLDVYFRISCDMELLKDLAKKITIDSEKNMAHPNLMNIHSLFEMTVEDSKDQTEGGKSSRSIMPTDSEINNFEEALDLVLTRNKALRTTQSEISTELKDRTQWLREEADWRRTLQEHAILSGKNPHDIKWRQWRDEFTANVSIRTYLDFPPIYKPELTITLVKMILFDDSPPILNEEMTQFYIEYSFLGYEGPNMETPKSLPKTSDGFEFNFRRKYPIDIVHNANHCKELAQFIKNGEKLIFNVISEPEVDLTVPIQTCELIGYCKVNMFEVAQLETNSAAYWFDIVNLHDIDQVIGYLKIQVDGIQAMRRIALKILAPPTYDIIQ